MCCPSSQGRPSSRGLYARACTHMHRCVFTHAYATPSHVATILVLSIFMVPTDPPLSQRGSTVFFSKSVVCASRHNLCSLQDTFCFQNYRPALRVASARNWSFLSLARCWHAHASMHATFVHISSSTSCHLHSCVPDPFSKRLFGPLTEELLGVYICSFCVCVCVWPSPS